jgi:hypothetical protein
MVSFRTALLALAAATTVAADYYIDPDTVPLSTRSKLFPTPPPDMEAEN